MSTNLVVRPTTCKLCGDSFYGPPGGSAVLIGETPTKRALRFTKSLVEHLEQKHPEIIDIAHTAGASFAGMLKIIQFDLGDELMQQQANYLRWSVKQQATIQRVSDQRIVERLKVLFQEMLQQGTSEAASIVLNDPNLFEPDQLGDKVVMLFRLMRDVLEEPNSPPDPFGQDQESPANGANQGKKQPLPS